MRHNMSHIEIVVTSCRLLPIYFYRQRARAPVLQIEARLFSELFPDSSSRLYSFSDGLLSIDSMPLLHDKDIVWIINLPLILGCPFTDLHTIQSSFQTAICPQSADKIHTVKNLFATKSSCLDCS